MFGFILPWYVCFNSFLIVYTEYTKGLSIWKKDSIILLTTRSDLIDSSVSFDSYPIISQRFSANSNQNFHAYIKVEFQSVFQFPISHRLNIFYLQSDKSAKK